MFSILLSIACAVTVSAQQLETLTAKPLAQNVRQSLESVNTRGPVRVPLITWGGDIATIHGDMTGAFKEQGLDVELFLENDFTKQVEGCLAGKTPYLRGTIGMINAAAEAFSDRGVELVVIYQLTWSNGGDALVVRGNIKRPRNLRRETIALQLYGPHMDYLANILRSGGVKLEDVDLKWFRELTLPTYDPGAKIVDPVSAFLADDNIDAAMTIIPDAMNLTSGGNEGTGSAGSVKGAKILLSTKTASRVIADVYAVRADYLKSNRSKVQSFVSGLMASEESLRDLLKDKASKRSIYQQLLGRSADLLLGSPQALPDVEALLGDCEFVGYDGNVAFFTGKGTTRTLDKLNAEIQSSFSAMGLVEKRVTLKDADWNYGDLASGLRYAKADAVPPKTKRFDAAKVAKKIEQKISVEPTSWAEEGTLFQIEISFDPNQSDFPAARYQKDFQQALEIAQTYGGSLIVVEGHSDPLGVLRARQKNEPSVVVQQMEQQAKNLSLLRSQAVRESFLTYARGKSISIDESQFVAVGLGISTPKFSPPKTKEEWAANRRVVFRIKQVEAELSEFVPLD
jgi:outer membrane protein OmpA-like peptidoglycan-associated protein/ABC-type nitrate/sulfonate/bicarbonate transport system substrate-binding protein